MRSRRSRGYRQETWCACRRRVQGKVALAAVEEDRTLAQLASRFGIYATQVSVYVYDRGQIALQFAGTTAGSVGGQSSSPALSHRYLWNAQAIDHLFADENVADAEVLYALTDHQGSVRDLVSYDAQNDVTTIENHRVYDSYGNLASETGPAVDCLLGYTGRQFDEASGLQNNLNRWYDPKVSHPT